MRGRGRAGRGLAPAHLRARLDGLHRHADAGLLPRAARPVLGHRALRGGQLQAPRDAGRRVPADRDDRRHLRRVQARAPEGGFEGGGRRLRVPQKSTAAPTRRRPAPRRRAPMSS